MPDQNPLDPLAGRLDQIIDAHREVLLPDGRTLLATERKALVTFARANGRRAQSFGAGSKLVTTGESQRQISRGVEWTTSQPSHAAPRSRRCS